MTEKSLTQGARVTTPAGEGTVVYVRLDPFNWFTVTSVSVHQDRDEGRPGYVGTIWSAKLVKVLP